MDSDLWKYTLCMNCVCRGFGHLGATIATVHSYNSWNFLWKKMRVYSELMVTLLCEITVYQQCN